MPKRKPKEVLDSYACKHYVIILHDGSQWHSVTHKLIITARSKLCILCFVTMFNIILVVIKGVVRIMAGQRVFMDFRGSKTRLFHLKCQNKKKIMKSGESVYPTALLTPLALVIEIAIMIYYNGRAFLTRRAGS